MSCFHCDITAEQAKHISYLIVNGISVKIMLQSIPLRWRSSSGALHLQQIISCLSKVLILILCIIFRSFYTCSVNFLVRKSTPSTKFVTVTKQSHITAATVPHDLFLQFAIFFFFFFSTQILFGKRMEKNPPMIMFPHSSPSTCLQ